MSLIDYKEELKRHNSSVTLQLSIESIQSFLDDAVNKHVIPAIGQTELTDFLSWKAGFVAFDEEATYAINDKVLFISSLGTIEFYAATAATAEGESPETNPAKWSADNSLRRSAFLLLQKATVNFAIAFYSAFGSLQLSDSGAHVISSGDNRIASDKKLIQLKRQATGDGYYALELAVDFLESNLGTFTDYAASTAHTRNRSSFINSTDVFNGISAIQVEPQLFANIKSIQRQIQEDQITTVLGEALVEGLIGKIKAGNPSADESALILRVQKAIVPLTLAEAIPYKLISIDASGVFQLSDTVGGISGNVENKRPVEDKAAQMAMMRLCSKGESELESLRKWLNTNADLFSDYTAKGSKSDQDVNTSGSGLYMM